MKTSSSSRFRLSFALFGVPSPFDPTCAFVTSSFLYPAVLGAVRALFAVFTLLASVVILGFEASVYGRGPSYLCYFTNLSYIGLCAYFWASSVQTVTFARALSGLRDVQDDAQAVRTRGKQGRRVERRRIGYPLQRWPRVFQLMHVLLYTSIVVFPFIITIVYWTLLASSQTFATSYNAFGNVSRHILNSAFALFEIICTNVPPPPWSHLVPVAIPLASYLGVAYITSATQGFYTYSFLNPDTHPARVAGYVFGITLAYCVVFAIIKGVITLRWRWSGRYWDSREDEERQGEPEALNDWEEVDSPREQSSAPRL